jgi:Tol biopolymer transport system component
MRRLIGFVMVSGLVLLGWAVATGPVQAKVPGPNGQIVFTRFDPAAEQAHVFTANPDGSHEHQLLTGDAGLPYWSPDGSQILVTMGSAAGSGRPAIINADGSGLRLLDVPEVPEDADMPCRAWSPDGTRLLCQVLRFGDDTSVNGIYTVRASDGGDLTRLTVSPYPPDGEFGGGDIPGDYSPDGSQFVFMRAKPGADPNARHQRGALFVENTDGTGLRQITPYGLPNSHDDAVESWSPDGSAVLFAGERGSLFVVHPDGTGVRAIPVDTGGGGSFARTPSWSPDGTSIVFRLFLDKAGQWDIYRVRSDGRELRNITYTPDFEDSPDWGQHPLATP